jgi:hypothetical protein
MSTGNARVPAVPGKAPLGYMDGTPFFPEIPERPTLVENRDPNFPMTPGNHVHWGEGKDMAPIEAKAQTLLTVSSPQLNGGLLFFEVVSICFQNLPSCMLALRSTNLESVQ